jgi:hypothetical protein
MKRRSPLRVLYFHRQEVRRYQHLLMLARNSFQVVFLLRSGAGSMPCRFNIAAIVMRPSLCLRFESAPSIRL